MTVRPIRPISDLHSEFGLAVRIARTGKHLSQHQLRDDLREITPRGHCSYISEIERGQRELDREFVEAIVQFLDMEDAWVSRFWPAPAAAPEPVLPPVSPIHARLGSGVWIAGEDQSMVVFQTELEALRWVAGDRVRFASFGSDRVGAVG